MQAMLEAVRLGDRGDSRVGKQQRQRDVLRHRKVRQDVKGLKDKAHGLAAQACQRIVIEQAQLGAIEQDATGVGAVKARNQVEQRGLANARLTHHGDVFARTEHQRNFAQHAALAQPVVGLGQ